MKIQEFKGDPNKRWVLSAGGWPLPKSAIDIQLQQKVKRLWWWRWKTIGHQHAMSPGEVEWSKRVVLDTPMLEARKRKEQEAAKKATDDYLNNRQKEN